MPETSYGVAKDRFTSLDTLAVVRELRTLGRARVDKVFDLPGGGWSVSVRSPGQGHRELVLVPGFYAAVVGSTPHSAELGPLARELRRLLTGTRVAAVAEPGGERYLEVEFEAASADPPLVLAVELFGTGNLLVSRGGRILAVQHSRTWAHRTVRVGAPYERPPARTNPWTIDVSGLEAALLASRTDRATTLAARLALGGPVAEELLVRAGLSHDAPATKDAARNARVLHGAIGELLTELGERPKGYLYWRQGVQIDAEPYRSRRFAADSNTSEEERPTFSEAAIAYFGALARRPSALESAQDLAVNELRRTRTQQERAVEDLGREVERLTKDAEAILANYSEAEQLVKAASGNAPDSIVELSVGGRTVPLRVDRPIRESAQSLFGEAKKVRARLDGARLALAETDRRLAEGRSEAETRARLPTPPVQSRRTPNWFERYRWFLSSEGILVIGGRDASTNDLIVRRYLKEGDVYVHADIHGAPSVIVKHPPPGEPAPTEATLEEAAQWGVSFSKAWRAGLASASAFWVNSDQVSKAGATGEFVPRGAWVIHGTRHVLKDLPTEVGLGTIRYKGEELWTAAPPRALERRGTLRIRLTPGAERERAEREVELVRELGMTRSRLQGLLPAGGITIRRV